MNTNLGSRIIDHKNLKCENVWNPDFVKKKFTSENDHKVYKIHTAWSVFSIASPYPELSDRATIRKADNCQVVLVLI